MQNSRVIPKATDKTGGFLSPPKLSNILLGLIIFFSATQLGLHFWPQTSLVYGIRVDYLSPTLYFLDLLILVYFFINKNVQQLIIDDWLLIVLLVNLLFTSNALSTLSWSLHLLLYTLFVNTLSLRLFTSSYFLIPLGASMIFQLVLATTQVTLGHSVDRLLYYLGERTIAVGQPAVALGTFMDSVVLRAYGTFSHPNTLAGWLVVSLLILIKIAPTKKLLIGNWLLIISTSATVAGVLLTQSRAAALALFGIVIPFYLIKTPKSKIMYFALLVIPISYFLLYSHPLAPIYPSLSAALCRESRCPLCGHFPYLARVPKLVFLPTQPSHPTRAFSSQTIIASLSS